jgi:hypothetical protein
VTGQRGIWRRPAVSVKINGGLARRPTCDPLGQLENAVENSAHESLGRRGDVTSRKGGNNPATWLKGGLAPSLFIYMHRSGLRLGSEAATLKRPTGIS